MNDVQDILDGYDAFARGDLDAVARKMAPDVLWHVPGRGSLAGDRRGRQEVLGYFGELFELSGGTFRAELRECGQLAPGLVTCIVHLSAEMPGGRVDQDVVQVFRRAHGLTREVTNYSADQYALDESDHRTPAGIVRRGYEAFARGDLATLTTLFAHDVEWVEPGRSAIAGRHHGIPAVLAMFGELFELSRGTFKAELIGCAEVAPGIVAALAQDTATMPGGALTSTNVHTFRVVDGLITEVISHPADGYAFDAAMGSTAITLPDARTAPEQSAAPIRA